MKKVIKISLVLVAFLYLSSCFKDIDTIALERPFGETFTVEHNIYSNITFYKVYENITLEVSNHQLGKWDLLFQSAGKGDNVILNYSISATAINTNIKDFSQVTKATASKLIGSDNWLFNDPAYSNIKDSLALKNWNNGNVYVLYRGTTIAPNKAYYKIQFISETLDSYTFKYAHIEDTEEKVVTINKTEGLVNRAYSFETNSVVDFEPNINEWDFFFAPYYGWYETLTAGIYSPYSLTGVIINNEVGIEIAPIVDIDLDYNQITRSMVEDFEFTSWKGAIGSTWKKIPDNKNPVYYMDEAKKYILKMPDGNYYKLRFLDYYNLDGKKGYPTFEINLLK